MKFRVGDRVILTTDRFFTSDANPYYTYYPNVVGIIRYITNTSSSFGITVDWSNDTHNSYHENDLSHVDSESNRLRRELRETSKRVKEIRRRLREIE